MKQKSSHTNIDVTFHGAAGSVTGSNFLVEGNDARILVDCGLEQGCKVCEDINREDFPYDPRSIDCVLITHAHMDHIGRLPKLVRDGFRGPIYSTPATREIAAIMLDDSRGILEKEAQRDGVEPIYMKEDVEQTLAQWGTISYYTEMTLKNGFRVYFKDAGHILGSAIIEIRLNTEKLVFTGDLGNSPAPLLRDTDVVDDATHMIMESVYGDRNHETPAEKEEKLEDVIEETVRRGGALMIPAFSLERTQVLLYHLNDLIEKGRIPAVPVFLDSPLAIRVTAIYKERIKLFNQGVRDEVANGDNIFDFPGLSMTMKTEESKAIKEVPNPKIILAGSGMSNGGRIVHHEKNYLPDANSTLLIVGYQVPGSMGRQLQDGAKQVEILGEDVPVRARVETIHGYSSHKDRDHLMYFAAQTADTVKTVFTAMGEPKSAGFLAQRLRDYYGINAIVPEKGEMYTLEM